MAFDVENGNSQFPRIPFEQSRPAADAAREVIGDWLLVG
jgi:hypothetical protein